MKPGETETRECQACFRHYEICLEPGVKTGQLDRRVAGDAADADFCPFCGKPKTELAE